MGATLVEKLIRAGVFSTVSQADQAVASLLKAGFTREQLTVICCDQTTEEHFRDCKHLEPAGAKASSSVLRGGEIGAALAGLATVAGLAAGGLDALTVAPIVVPAGAVFGGMVGGMIQEGRESELSEFYQQAVADGNILVAVADHSERHQQMLAEASRIFTEAGGESIEMAEG